MRAPQHLPAFADAAIPAYRFVKPGSADGRVALATAATDKLLGISNQLGFIANDTGDRIVAGEAELQLGATVAFGDRLTSDASGCGVAVSAAGQTIGAIAHASGVAGDIIPALVVFAKN